uniref:uncharacterized protein LOC120339710 n=1 Tax=Styela clava TaxID=7725 RepID=UPI00193A0A28|nr:uncharacterized protein LOC120339710 [Styela clava]
MSQDLDLSKFVCDIAEFTADLVDDGKIEDAYEYLDHHTRTDQIFGNMNKVINIIVSLLPASNPKIQICVVYMAVKFGVKDAGTALNMICKITALIPDPERRNWSIFQQKLRC